MAGQIELQIVTAEKRLFSARVDEVRAPGAEGSFGVRPGHVPFLTLAEPGELWFKGADGARSFAIGSGFIEVSGDRVTVLAETAEAAADIDVERARKALADAQAKLVGTQAGTPAHAEQALRAKAAQARIQVGSAA